MSDQLPVDRVIILNLGDEGIINLILEMDIVEALPVSALASSNPTPRQLSLQIQ